MGETPALKGMVLAAGAGRRLRPETEALPKTLLAVDGDDTVLDLILRNLAAVGIDEVVVVVGYAADAVVRRRAELERRHGVAITLVHNDRAEDWNNAYSLWSAREHLRSGVLLVNGDTVHPVSVEKTLLAARGPGVLLAVDDVKPLGDEEMKVAVDADGLRAPHHQADGPGRRRGGVHRSASRGGHAVDALVDALEVTWRRDPQLYYEDGFQELLDRGRRSRPSLSPSTVVGRDRRPRRPREGAGDRMSLLTRMLASPLVVDIRAGAVDGLAALLADRHVSSTAPSSLPSAPVRASRSGEESATPCRTQEPSSS